MLAFLTPIAKAFMTEVGFEAANHGVQIYGGHGFIAEWGMEQNVRDSRISCLYEGTTGIQALDLLGRKVLMTQGEALKGFTKIVHKFCRANRRQRYRQGIRRAAGQAEQGMGRADHEGRYGRHEEPRGSRCRIGRLSDVLRLCMRPTSGPTWRASQPKLAAGTEEEGYKAKLQTARFYFARILPRTRTHVDAMLSGADNLMEMAEEDFALGY